MKVEGGLITFQRGLPWKGPRQCIRVIASDPPRGLANPKREVMVKTGSFMEVLSEAQTRFKGKQLRIQTLVPKSEAEAAK